ncbi:KpsF/GutQ family sugar-phosphate isomerase [Parvularcula dongshanensis]|uniref:Arabinose-5-phosphate isomerase n=1 Tax=Parvularcula dongshanensis TaxID=1173995 RepID=A0A840I4D6_9PROT|nr:KpsF/GutQ family sugar-phosphate isomerase [Parvularcula dongshanensis]MBB4659141.1 arabinose-5-phosphate isomerase [Parvularcula dongshanensis]
MSRALETAAAAVRTERCGVDALLGALDDPATPLARAFDAAFDALLHTPGRVIVTGMGKSGHVARKIASTLASTGQRAAFVHPGEASHGDLGMIGEEDVVLALSNSGETPELGSIVTYCSRFGVPLIAVTSVPQSSLSKAADIVLPLPDAEEACRATRAPTTSTTLAVVLGDALAVALLDARGFTSDDFRTLHPGGKLGASLKRVRDLMHEGRELPLVPLRTPVREAVSVLSRGGFGCVGVLDGDALVGIATDGDIRRHIGDDLDRLTVEAMMTRGPKTVSPDTLAAEALGILSRTKITALFVVEGTRPVGLLHVHDCLDTGVL